MSVGESLDKTHYFTVANAFFPLVFPGNHSNPCGIFVIPAENSWKKSPVLPHRNNATFLCLLLTALYNVQRHLLISILPFIVSNTFQRNKHVIITTIYNICFFTICLYSFYRLSNSFNLSSYINVEENTTEDSDQQDERYNPSSFRFLHFLLHICIQKTFQCSHSICK